MRDSNKHSSEKLITSPPVKIDEFEVHEWSHPTTILGPVCATVISKPTSLKVTKIVVGKHKLIAWELMQPTHDYYS